MIFSPFEWRRRDRQAASRLNTSRRKRRQELSGKTAAGNPEQLEQRKMLAFDFVAAFADSTVPFYVQGVNTGAAELNESPQQLTLRFSPGTVIDASTLNDITLARTGRVGDPFGNGGAYPDVAITPGSISVGDAPNENEVVLRFAEDLVDDVYRVSIGGQLRTVTGEQVTPASFDIRLDLGAFVTSVVPQPIIRGKTLELTSVPQDGDLLELSVRGSSVLFTFDSDPAAVDGTVDPATTGLVIATDGRTAADVVTTIRDMLNPGGSPSSVFGGEMVSIGGTDGTISLVGESFTPTVAFHRMISTQTIEFAEVPANGSTLDVSILGSGLQILFDSDPEAVTGTIDPDTSATIVATDSQTPRTVAIAVQGILSPRGLPSLSFGGQMESIVRSNTTITLTGRTNTPDAVFTGDAVLDADELPVLPLLVTQSAPYSIVPDGIASVSDDGLTQLRDTVVVHFNADDPLDESSAESPLNYQLFESDPVSGAEAAGIVPTSVSYDSVSATAVLTFAAGDVADGKLYRLQVGNAAADPGVVINTTEIDDENSSFATATGLGTLAAAGGDISGEISVRPLVPSPVGSLPFPSQLGPISEPGHRDVTLIPGEQHGSSVPTVGPAENIIEQAYNFQSVYGQDPQGNTLFNAITETQKQRAREIFEIYSRYAGIRFIETADQGLTIVTGDMRAIAPNINTNPSGLAGNGTAIMDSTEDWGDSEYGGYWFRVALHEIGHLLGLAHSYDIPSNMGSGIPGEPIFSGDYDLEHFLQLYPKTGSDIDVYSFTLASDGQFSAETVVARPGTEVLSTLDSVLTLYREDANGVREMIARNDDYYGRDSFLSLDLEAADAEGNVYTYFIAVTSTGNTAFDPAVDNSGYGGRTDGEYELRLQLDPVRDTADTIFDVSGTKLDGDRTGEAGGEFSFWFKTAAEDATLYVDKAASSTGADGSLAAPYTTISQALNAAKNANFSNPGTFSIIRIVGNSGNAATDADDLPYLVGKAPQGNPLSDGATFNVPKDMTVMIDADAVLKMRATVIDVGSSSPLPSVSRAGAALQVLGTPGHSVRFTSYHDDTLGGDTDGAGPVVAGGDWGGIVLRQDSDAPSKQAFLNSISNADIQYGGGQVLLNSRLQSFAPIHLESTRPTLAFNRITNSSGAGISADPNSFEETNGRIGPELRGNFLDDNTINGLFIRISTAAGSTISKLTVPARLTSTDIVYVLAENLIIEGNAGGYVLNAGGNLEARDSGRLAIDAGVVVKLSQARIELERGTSQLIAEGQPGNRVVFTSFADNRYGAGGTFDTNGSLPNNYAPGDWGGIMLNAGTKASIDSAYLGFGGGTTPIEGGFDQFNVIEVHQGDLRLANSRVEANADGLANTNRTGRGDNAAATIFVRGAQPIIVGNDFRDNAAALISINANSLNDLMVPDSGRSTGWIARYTEYDDNFGPLVRDNRISYYVSTPVVSTPPPAFTFPGFSNSAPTALETHSIQWNGVPTEVVVDSWVMRTAPGADFVLTAGWDLAPLGDGYYNLATPGTSQAEVMAWAVAQTGVSYIEPNFVFDTSATYPNDPNFDQLWGLHNTGQLGGQPDADIDAPEAWDITTGSRSVVIAVIDSGVDYTHPDLANNIWVNPGEIPGDGIDNDGNGYIDDVNGWDFAYGDADPMDVDGHGTHVAGTIGASADNGIGVSGVAWDVQIMALKGLGDTGTGSSADLLAAVNYATMMRRDHGINVVATNNSWGGVGGYSQAMFDAIEAAGREGVLFVAAAGNFSLNNDVIPFYPASYDSDNIISVAATDMFNNLAGFSHVGATSVDIGAPGVDILSTLPNDSYGMQQGTSMAAPHVAGVAALLAAYSPSATSQEIRQAILSSAVPNPSLAGQVSTGGVLNAAAALDAIQQNTGISGMVVRGGEITVESVWDDVDIIHVLRSEIIVNNLHTKTGVRLMSQSNASLVVKAAGSSAGFTAAGYALEIDDRIGGTVQVVGQPGYPVVMTSFADDSIGVSLDALGRVVRDTNGDGLSSQPAAGDWRGLRFLQMSNDRNVAIVQESEVAYTSEFQANGTVDSAEYLGILAPNYASENSLGALNTWESAQEAGGDDNRRLGYEIHGTISYDDTTDADVYSFSGYGGSEVWIDIDNTSSALDTMVELLDADGNVLARSADALGDSGTRGLEIVPEGDGGQALVDGVNQAATGVAAVANGMAAIVQGEEEGVTGTAALADGVASLVAGEDESVTGTAAVTDGVFGRVQGATQDVDGVATTAVRATTTAQRIATTVAGDVTNRATVQVDDITVVTVGANVLDENGIARGTVVSINAATSELTLDQNVTLGNGALLSFSIPVGTSLTSIFVVVQNPNVVQTGVPVTLADGTVAGTVLSITNDIVEISAPITVTRGDQLGFGYRANTQTITVTDAAMIQVGAAVTYDGVATGVTVESVNRGANQVTFTANVGVAIAHDSLIAFSLPDPAAVPTTDIVVADTTTITLNTPVSIDGVPTGARVAAIDAVGGIVTLDTSVTVTNSSVIGFGTTATDITIDTTDFDAQLVGSAVTVNGVATGETVVSIAADVVTLSNAIEVAHGDVMGFDYAGAAVTTDQIRVDDATVATVGSAVTINGVASGETVAEIVSATTIRLSGDVAVANGDFLGFDFAGAPISTTRIRVADTTGITAGVLVNGVAGLPANLRVASVDPVSGTVTFNQAATVSDGDLLGFGFNGTTIILATTFTDNLSGAAVTLNGVDTGETVASLAGSTLILSGSVDVANGDLLGFDFAGNSVTSDLFRVDDASVATVGVAVTLNGVATGLTVAEVVSPTVIRLSGNATVSDGDFFGFDFAGAPIATTRVRVADTTGITAGVLVNGVAGLPADLRVASVDAVSGTVTLDQVATVDNGDTLGFGFNAVTITLENDFDTSPAGAAVEINGIDSGETVVTLIGNQLTLTGLVDVADGDLIGIDFVGASDQVDSDIFRVDDATVATVGAAVALNGVDTGETVAEVLSDSIVRLTGAVIVSNGDFLSFDFAGAPIATTRVRIADTTGIDVGVLVNGVAGLPADLRVASIDVTSGTVTFDQAAIVSENDLLGFGVIGTTITVDDLTEIEVGSTVAGDGVPAGVTVVSIDTDTNSLTLSDTVDVADGATLFFGTRAFQLPDSNILPGTLHGVVYEGNTAIQTFTVDRAGVFTFTTIGNPVSEVIAAQATLDRDTGLITLPFDVVPTDDIRVEVGYDFATVSLATLGFQPDGTNGAFPLEKDGFRDGDMYSLNPRDAGMRLILPGAVGELQEYFVRVRSQARYNADATVAEYEASLTSFDFATPGDIGSGATSGHYELRLRLRQQDEKPGSTVRYGELRYPTIGIDVVGLPRNTQLAGENGENPNDINDAIGQAQPLGNLLATDRNTISVAGSMRGENDVDWYSFTLDYQQIQAIGGVNSGGKSWPTLFDIDYADGFRGDLTMSIFDEQGRLIYVGRDSNVTDDQPGVNQANDFDDLSRGSLGKLDPFIGSVFLPAGNPGGSTTYYVAISTNEQLPSALDGTFSGSATNPTIRLEPISSLDRVVEDRIGTTGYLANGILGPRVIAPETGALIDMTSSITLDANVRPFTLGDVVLFVSTPGSIRTVDAYQGGIETTLVTGRFNIGDIDMRTDGRLFQYDGPAGDGGNNGILREINSANGGIISSAGDGVSNDPDDPTFWQITGNSVDAVAIRRTGVATYDSDNNLAIVYSIRDTDGNSYLYWARSDGSADTRDNDPHGRRGQLSGGTTGVVGNVTGLQFRNETGTLFGVSQSGQFLRVGFGGGFGGGGLATPIADFSGVLNVGETFEGLATAPVNLENARYQGMFFAITSEGRLVCIDPDTNTLLANVFDTDGDGYADSHISLPTVAGATGLAFSPLDVNLWHPTELRDADAGHGQVQPPDNTRATAGSGRFGGGNNVSMYFGLEQFRTGSGGYFDTKVGSVNQFGTEANTGYNWQEDLAAGSALTAGGNNYNLPGGAYGSMITNPFSLAGYDYTDKPTLYFDYFLDTEDASSKSNGMRDSARVFVSVDDGLTWEMVATNNQARSSNGTQDGELPAAASTSSAIATPFIDNQHAQELFDSTGSWRQARVDLGSWAGASSIRLRFDFSTAGEMNAGDRNSFTPDTILTIAAPAADEAVITLASVEGLEVGMLVRTPLDVDGEAALRIPAGTHITDIDAATGEVTLENAVTLPLNAPLHFFRGTPDLQNDIVGNAGTTGNFNDPSRGANNNFEGFYVDNIIVGFAERGEMVTNAQPNQTGFFNIGTPTTGNYFEQVLEGAYQLEIRRGTEYGVLTGALGNSIAITQTFDTNDRLVPQAADTVLTLEENTLGVVDGTVVTTRGTGTVTPQVDFFGNPAGLQMAGLGGSQSTTEHNAVFWSIDLDNQPAAFFAFDYETAATETLTALPETFQLTDTEQLPYGDGVAVSLDGGVSWTTVGNFTATGGATKRLELDLIAKLGVTQLTAETVIGFFQSGQQTGGITVANAEITTAPIIRTSGLVGDQNFLREQGQFLIESNIVSHAAQYGIRIDAGLRTPGTNAPHPGVARNLPTINHDGLVPGAVIVNNIVASSGQAGILFSGDPNVGNVPDAVVPYGRIINNTIYGGDTAGGIGVQVTENAAPTMLNNLFANLDIGVEVDGSSQQLTVVGFSAHYNVASPVSGTIENDGMVLTSDPFVDASTENFYLTELTPAIDSAIDVLQDRNDFVVVKNAIGLPPSPVIAPARDLYGQLRADDPAIAGSVPGIGLNVFKDRGAVDRVDFTQPTIALAVPLDNSPIDQEKLQPNMVRLERQSARGRSRFVLQLNDIGVGIDKATVASNAFRITYSPYPGAPASLERVLIEGADYLYRFLEASNEVVFESAAVYPLGTYRVDVTTREASRFLPALLTDLAGRPLLPNANDGSISFTISLSDKPSMPRLTGIADEGQVSLDWTAAANGLAITGFELEQSENGGAWTVVTLPDPVQTSITVIGLTDGASYQYRVRATNDLGTSDWGLAGPFTPLQVPTLGLANDTGLLNDDGITNDGLISVGNLLTGGTWEYSTNSGITWKVGAGDSFSLLPRTYAAGTVQVRQTFAGATSSPGTNAIDLVVDVTAPFAPAITAIDDDAGLINGIVRNGSITDDATPTLYGTAEGSSIVSVYDGADLLGTTRADSAGIWNFTPTADLDNRIHAFAALAQDLAGNTGPQSPAYTITIDTEAPEVSIDRVNDDLEPFTGRIDNGGRTNDQTLTLVGRSSPFTTVIIKSGGTEIGRAVTNSTGDWNLVTVSLAAGTYDFVASVTDPLGRTGVSATYTVTIDRTPPSVPAIAAITDNVGTVQGAIPDGGTTDDTTPTISGTAEPNAYISIFVTLPDGTASIEGGISLRANATGNWSFTPSPLVNGTYSFKAIATDEAGNSSAFSAIRTLTVAATGGDTPVTPGVLAITAVTDNAGSVQGDVPHNGTTDDATLEVAGTAPAASVVEIRDGSTLLGSVVASAAGTWSYTTRPLANGVHSLTATVGADTTPARTVIVQVDATNGADITASAVWGPDPAEGYRTVLIDFNQPVTGVTVDAFMIEHRGRKILVQGATVTGGGMNYVLKLPDRFRNLTGGFTITLFSTDIESLLNPGSTMRKPQYFDLPDPGVNNNPGG